MLLILQCKHVAIILLVPKRSLHICVAHNAKWRAKEYVPPIVYRSVVDPATPEATTELEIRTRNHPAFARHHPKPSFGKVVANSA